MKGENEMSLNFNSDLMLSQELQRDRMREAEQERLVRKVTTGQPSLARKLYVILRCRLDELFSGRDSGKHYPPITQLSKNSPNL
jgi:hypothetical protein